MKKSIVGTKAGVPLSGSPNMMGYMYHPYQFQNLEGQLLTFLETLGLRETQEKAAKDLLKQTLWRWSSESQFIREEIVQQIFESQLGSNLPNNTSPRS